MLRAKAIEEGHALPEQEYRRLEQQLQQVDDHLEELRDELTAVQGQLAADLGEEHRFAREATARVHRAEEALREAAEARLPLLPGTEPGDLAKRLQELLEGTNRVGTEDHSADDEPDLARRWLTVNEYAAVMGSTHSTIRRYIRDALASEDGFPFAGGAANHRNPWFQPIEQILESYGPRTRRFNFDTLELSRYTPGQIAAMKRLLASFPTAA